MFRDWGESDVDYFLSVEHTVRRHDDCSAFPPVIALPVQPKCFYSGLEHGEQRTTEEG
jgi:hypothetical protein